MKNKITVTQPALPLLEEFIPYLKKIWDSKWLTNNGPFHQQLEKELSDYLGIKYISLFNNGTDALLIALKALDVKGEVITTPFSFVATTNAIVWNNCQPVFCDIDPDTMNIDPDRIESLITSNTSAIMPVHVYGNPCNNEKIEQITRKFNLKLIYDAAHAFNVKKNGESILNWGSLSILSFHATKVFNTLEGGAIICHSKEMKQKIDRLRNFGFVNEIQVTEIGINGKINELQAAFGLLQLKKITKNIKKRNRIAEFYRKKIDKITGIEYLKISHEVDWNYGYFPIFVDENIYCRNRDELYDYLKQNNIFGRRYFYPLISNFETYNSLKSADKSNLTVANRIAEKVLCLPVYPDLQQTDILKIVELLSNKS